MRMSFQHSPIALAALLALGAGSSLAQPAPNTLPVQRPGGALINATVGTPSGNALTVTQTGSASNRGLVEWSSFSIGSAARVNIVQPNAQSVLVNRVVGTGTSGPSASEIYGAMSANGRVFLVNPGGVVFGGSAQVNVGSLVATSLDLDSSMTANNYQRLMQGGEVVLGQGGTAGGIRVLAADDASRPQIQVTEGGSIVLVSAGPLAQGGHLAAAGGRIHLASAGGATLLPVGTSGFVDVALQPGGGSVELGSGSLTVAHNGGQVSLQGDHIRLSGGSQVLADGSAGGGRIDVGNDHTRSIVAETGSLLSADATEAGNGGSVTLRAMFNNQGSTPVARVDYGVTEAYGSIRARGGVNGGNGGQVETSGAAVNTRLAAADGTLTHRGVVDASARAAGGQSGTWTLDPYNVTISDATATVSPVNGSFVPSGPGANVNAADLSAALNGGTNVEITTGTAQTGAEAGDITLARDTTVTRSAGGGTATLTLRAHNDIVLQVGSTLQGSTGNGLNVNLYSNLDGTGAGAVLVGGTVRTFGGNVDIGGGLTPATGYARSNGQTDGVVLSGALIDTRGATGRGDVSMRGETPSGTATRGVTIDNSSVFANNITLSGRSSQGAGVALGGVFGAPSTLDTASGLISVRGFADGLVSTGADSTGVVLENIDFNLGSAGSLYVAGRSNNQSGSFGPAGVRFRNTNIVAATDSTGSITLAGEITGNAGLGGLAFFNAQSGPLTISAGFGEGGPEATSANVVLGGSSAAQGLAIDLGTSPGTEIRTTGTVNLRPLGVDTDGNLVERPGTEIAIGTEATGNAFYVNSQWLVSPTSESTGIAAGRGVVIGSSLHSGRITLEDGALQQHTDVSLTLQNQGANSAGIELRSGNEVQDLGLRTTGNITQTGPITVARNLVIEGGAQTTVALSDTGNSIGNLAFDPPASLTLQTTGPLSIGAASTAGYTPGTGFTPLSITTSLGGTTALIQSTGAITLNQSIAMVGANAQLNVVAPSITVAPGVTVSAPTGGTAKLWTASFSGVAPGTNLYGCVYGDTTTCSVSGIALPTTGNQLLHPTQPTLLVAANPLTGYVDLALPTLSFSTTGLVNGDTPTGALAGSLATTPTGTGTYAIGQGSLTSPLGYNLTFAPSTLTLRPGVTRQMLQSSFQAELASDVYGRNLDQPQICTAASVLRGTLADDKLNDPLASEWGKVRNQPQLSGCLNVTDGGSCSAF